MYIRITCYYVVIIIILVTGVTVKWAPINQNRALQLHLIGKIGPILPAIPGGAHFTGKIDEKWGLPLIVNEFMLQAATKHLLSNQPQ